MAEKHGETATAIKAQKAKAGLKGLGSELLHTVAEAGEAKGPKPYIMAYGVKVDAEKGDTFRGAARQFLDANRKSKNPVRITVHRPASGQLNQYLVLIGADDLSELDPDGKHNDARLSKAVGAESAAEVAGQLKEATDFVWRQPLRYVAAFSNP